MLSLVMHKEKKNLISSLPLGALISLKQSSVFEIPMWPYLMLCVCCVCMCVRQGKKSREVHSDAQWH